MATKLSVLVGGISSLKQLAQPLRRLQNLQELYSSIVPPELMHSTEVGFVENECLVMYVSHGSASANLRQRLPSLLDQFRQFDAAIEKIRIEVQVNRNVTSSGKREIVQRKLPSSGLESFEKLAMELEDSPLKEAIKKLLKT